MPIVLKSGSLNLLEPSGPVKACNGIALPLLASSTTCLSSGGATQTTIDKLCGCYVSWLLPGLGWKHVEAVNS
jgi:hypothetical protein